MSAPLEDYALIGDCRSAALVHRSGSIDWLCLPRFDAPACLAALLGTREHGRWSITAADAGIRRRYLPGTMVLETEFTTPTGSCHLVDCMVVDEGNPTIVRMLEGITGTVTIDLDLIIRFDYGSITPWVREHADHLEAIAGPDTLRIYTAAPLRIRGPDIVASFEIHAGQRIPFTLIHTASHAPHPPPTVSPHEHIDRTVQWWQAWSDRCTYRGPDRALVQRSLLVLKALTYAPTGGIVAAPTTSLPEHLGGVRNWDYRYCWLRDATFTLYALLSAGYRDEAIQWREWLVRAVAGTPNQINIMYGLGGERRLPELTLDWLPGYADSRPVRIGNAAHAQHQLDVFGEVMDTLCVTRRAGLPCSADAWRVQTAMLEYLESAWDKPDNGIWEVRGPQRHFTHSKVMAWVALDRGIQAVQHCGHRGPVERWTVLRDRIHAEVCSRGFDPALNSFVQSYESTELDASLLILSLVGFLPASDPRIAGTVAAVERTLLQDGLVQRYRPQRAHDGLPGDEGVFLACSFWLADNYLLLGRHAEARALFDRLLGLANDVGLLAEQYDTNLGRLVGNFPQAFSHIALVNTACNLSRQGGPAEDRSHPAADARAARD